MTLKYKSCFARACRLGAKNFVTITVEKPTVHRTNVFEMRRHVLENWFRRRKRQHKWRTRVNNKYLFPLREVVCQPSQNNLL